MHEQPKHIAELRAELEKLNAFYERIGKAGPYLLGENPSLADIAIIPFLERFEIVLHHYREYELLPPKDTKVQRLKAALEAARTRPAFRSTKQSAELYISGYSKYAKQTNAELRAAQNT